MGYFKFLHGSKIIWLPFNVPEKLFWQHLFQEPEETETHSLYLSQYNTIATHPDEQYPPFNQRGPLPFFHLDANPALGHVLVHSVDKPHDLVVIVELIWLLSLNVLSFNFISTPNKSLLVWQDLEEAMETALLLFLVTTQVHCFFALPAPRCSKWSRSFFSQLFVPKDSAFAYPIFLEHNFGPNVVNSKVGS